LIDPASARDAADILKWQAARMTPKMYGDRQQVDVQAVKGGSYLELLTKVNDAAKDRLIESKEDTQPDRLRARDEVNQNPVNKKLHKKKAKQRK
jgi:gas vesicle protein